MPLRKSQLKDPRNWNFPWGSTRDSLLTYWMFILNTLVGGTTKIMLIGWNNDVDQIVRRVDKQTWRSIMSNTELACWLHHTTCYLLQITCCCSMEHAWTLLEVLARHQAGDDHYPSGWRPTWLAYNCATKPTIWPREKNPLRAIFFRENSNIYLHFMSFLHIDITQAVEILPQARQELNYFT